MALSDAFSARRFASVPSRSSRAPSLRFRTRSATASASCVANKSSTSVSPTREVGRDKGVVVQLGIGGVETIDALALAGAERLLRIEAFDRGHQTLAAQDLVASWNATSKVVLDIEHHRVAVRHERIERQNLGRNGA